MPTKVEALREGNHAVFILRIPFAKLLQNIDFYKSLLMEALLVADNLDSDQLSELVVNASQYLSKTTLSEDVYNLVAVCQVVSSNNGVVAAFIVIAKIGGRCLQIAHHFTSTLSAAKVDIVIVDNLASFVDVEHSDANGFLRAHTLLWRCPLFESIQSSGGNICLLASGADLAHLSIGL